MSVLCEAELKIARFILIQIRLFLYAFINTNDSKTEICNLSYIVSRQIQAINECTPVYIWTVVV